MASRAQTQYNPDYVSPPGETLLEALQERGMSQVDLAQRMGRTSKLVNEIIKGKAPITPETALQLEHTLRIPASFWNNRERTYRESLARVRERETLAAQTVWLDQFPVTEMIAWHWIDPCDDRFEQLIQLLNFFGVASPAQWDLYYQAQSVLFRQSKAFEIDLKAVTAWLRRGEIEAQGMLCSPFDLDRFSAVVFKARDLVVAPALETAIEEIRDLFAAAGVAIVFVPALSKTRVSGATRWLTPDKALIQLSLRHQWADHMWFTLFHETAHILRGHSKKSIFINSERDQEDAEAPKEEREADQHAGELLIPAASLKEFTGSMAEGRVSKDRVLQFAKEARVTPGIVVGRLQHDRVIPYSHLNQLRDRLEWKES